MRLPTLLLLLLLCTCVCAQKSRIDTVPGPVDGMLTYRFITEMPAGTKMSKAERFMRGIRGTEPAPAWDQLDSLVVVDAETGKKYAQQELNEILKVEGKEWNQRPTRKGIDRDNPASLTLYFATNYVVLDGRIGEDFTHYVTVLNGSEQPIEVDRVDGSELLETQEREFAIPPKSELNLAVLGQLPAGSTTYPLVLAKGDSLRMEVRFSLNGYDINEEDFVPTRQSDQLPVWVVPEGREVLYLRLRSTEKLMTVYRNDRVYNKVAVGRQLDELTLVGLAPGEYLLEVIDLRTGGKRYHGLRRELTGR